MPAQCVELHQENNCSRSRVLAWISYRTCRQQLLNLVTCDEKPLFDSYPVNKIIAL
jgi:hypothetical protein